MDDEGRGLDSSGPEYNPMVRFCDYGNELLGSIKDEEFVQNIDTQNYQL
jgi:hypothetical protein